MACIGLSSQKIPSYHAAKIIAVFTFNVQTATFQIQKRFVFRNPVQDSRCGTLDQNKIALKFSCNKNWTFLPFKPLELNHTCYCVIRPVEQDEFDDLTQIPVLDHQLEQHEVCCIFHICWTDIRWVLLLHMCELWGMSSCVLLLHCMTMAVPFNLW